MNIWKWLQDCYDEGSITVYDLENVLKDDKYAKMLGSDWLCDSNYFLEWIRREVAYFIDFIKTKEVNKKKE